MLILNVLLVVVVRVCCRLMMSWLRKCIAMKPYMLLRHQLHHSLTVTTTLIAMTLTLMWTVWWEFVLFSFRRTPMNQWYAFTIIFEASSKLLTVHNWDCRKYKNLVDTSCLLIWSVLVLDHRVLPNSMEYLHIHWSQHVTNAEISTRTSLPPVMDFIRRCRLSVFGHIARLSLGTQRPTLPSWPSIRSFTWQGLETSSWPSSLVLDS